MNSKNDEALWTEAAKEVDDESSRNAGLWARCFSEADGDHAKTRARYMSERVRQMGGQVTAPVTATAPVKRSLLPWLLWPLGILALGFVVLVTIGSRMPDDGRYDAQAVIEQCWKEQKNPEFDDATKRFAAAACNKMIREYREKYGREP